MNRVDLIRGLIGKARPAEAVKPKGLFAATTGTESAVKKRTPCEYKRDGNWRSNNFGHGSRSPREVAAKTIASIQATEGSLNRGALIKAPIRREGHHLNRIAERLKRGWHR